MSIYGISPNVTTPLARPAVPPSSGARIDGTRVPQGAPAQPQAAPAARVAPEAGAAAPAGVPVQAPAGTDPELWSVLTGEERAFFAKATASGPLTYGRMMSAARSLATAAPVSTARGGRLDVRA